MSENLDLSVELPATPQQVYEAWLDSAAHGQFTGSPAQIDPRVGGKYTAWDGYITGETTTLEPYRRILQTWRSSEFPEGAEDSLLEVLLAEIPGGTKLTLRHTNIPDGQSGMYEEGWRDYYFKPMLAYFQS